MRETVVYGIRFTDGRGDYLHGNIYRSKRVATIDAERMIYAGIINKYQIVSFFLV